MNWIVYQMAFEPSLPLPHFVKLVQNQRAGVKVQIAAMNFLSIFGIVVIVVVKIFH